MLEPHHRAALIPSEPGVNWHHFVQSRYVESLHSTGKAASLAMVVRIIEQRNQVLADIRGLVELSWGASLPVVSDFVGLLNLESREISIHQVQPEKVYSGQISENGRVMVLRLAGQSKPICLVHEQTLAQLV